VLIPLVPRILILFVIVCRLQVLNTTIRSMRDVTSVAVVMGSFPSFTTSTTGTISFASFDYTVTVEGAGCAVVFAATTSGAIPPLFLVGVYHPAVGPFCSSTHLLLLSDQLIFGSLPLVCLNSAFAIRISKQHLAAVVFCNQ
jgi:hypothetical protein